MAAAEDRVRELVSRRVRVAPDAPAEAATDWHSKLMASGNGYAGDENGILLALRSAPELAGLVRFNEFALDVEFTRRPPWRSVAAGEPWREDDDTHLAAWLQAQRVRVRSKGAVADCVVVAARDAPFHPVRDYLRALRWDGCPRLDTWLAEYLCAQGPAPYLAAVGRRFLVSAVARVMQPGCQADHVLVLEGAQGAGKTSAARALAVRGEWFAGNLPDLHSKDAPLQLAGRWIVEIAELKAIRASQTEATKSFLTQCADTFRPPYARRTAQFPRQSVFIATTNESEYLRDRTGNRRFWPVRVGVVARQELAAMVGQLWAEALAAFDACEPWHLTDEETRLAETEQCQRVHISETEAAVMGFLEGYAPMTVTIEDVLAGALGVFRGDPNYAERGRRLGPEVAEALIRAGWSRDARRQIGGTKSTLYRRSGQGGHGQF